MAEFDKWFAPASTLLGSLLGLKGNIDSARAVEAGAENRMVAAGLVKRQTDANQNDVKAASQRTAADLRRQGAYINSEALARAAAGGGGASDPTIINLMARTAAEASYRSHAALYEGEDQARRFIDQGNIALYSAQVGANQDMGRAGALRGQGVAALMRGAGVLAEAQGLFRKYGQGGPDAVPNYGAGWDETTQGAG